MADGFSHYGPLPFADFLAHLRRQGFTIGVGHYLRLQQVLTKVGDECAPQELKTLLCPLFATNDKEQALFYRAFDTYFALFKASPVLPEADAVPLERAEPHADKAPLPTPRRWHALLAYATFLTLIVGIAVYFSWGLLPKPLQESPPSVPVPRVPSPEPLREAVTRPAIDTEARSLSRLVAAHQHTLRYAVVFLPLFTFVLYEWLRWRRRTLIVQRARGRKPPYEWPLHVEGPTLKEYSSEEFFRAARDLRRRQVGEFHRLDVAASVAATVQACGYPRFCYRPDSRTPEYLVLVESTSMRDHQAHLFDALCQALQREDLFVVRYFYDGDPRVCWAEHREGAMFLADLQKKYPEHRLLLFGNGDSLIDPLLGKLASWATIFLEWQDRAILTPEPQGVWGLREKTLATYFVLLPATLAGLEELADRFVLPTVPETSPLKRHGMGPVPPDTEQPITVEALRDYLGDEVFQWLCACAVYPELYWELTLYVGALPCFAEGLVQEKHLLQLLQLPWFRTGSMPDEVRLELIQHLDPAKEQAVRAALIAILENSPAPEGSFAADARRLEVVAQRAWLHRHNRRVLRQTMRELRTVPPSEITRDYALVRFLESTAVSPLALRLPKRLQQFFYEGGLPAFGLKTSVRGLVTLVVAAVALAAVNLVETALEEPAARVAATSASELPEKPPAPPAVVEVPAPSSPQPRTDTPISGEIKSRQDAAGGATALPQTEAAAEPDGMSSLATPTAAPPAATEPAPEETSPPVSPETPRSKEAPALEVATRSRSEAGVAPSVKEPSSRAAPERSLGSQQGLLPDLPPAERESRPGKEYVAIPPQVRPSGEEAPAVVPPAPGMQAPAQEEGSPAVEVATKTAPTVSAALSEAEVQAWLEIWRRAWEERDVERLRHLGAVSSQNVDALRKVLGDYKSFRVAVRDPVIRAEENRATVNFLRIDTIDGKTTQPVNWTLTLEKEKSGGIALINWQASEVK